MKDDLLSEASDEDTEDMKKHKEDGKDHKDSLDLEEQNIRVTMIQLRGEQRGKG